MAHDFPTDSRGAKQPGGGKKKGGRAVHRAPFATLALGLALSLAAGGCVTANRSRVSARVLATIEKWKAGLEGKDIDAVVACYSDRYVDYNNGDKVHLREKWGEAMAEGFFDNLTIHTDRAEVTFTKESAVVWPIHWRGVGPDHSIEFTLEKEDGDWLIVGMDGL